MGNREFGDLTRRYICPLYRGLDADSTHPMYQFMGSSIHQTIFNRMPNPAMILNKNLVFVDANDAYCRAVQRHRTEIIGRSVFDVFPNTPERTAQVKESFEKTLAGETVALDPQVVDSRFVDPSLENRTWQITQFRVHCEEGNADYLVQRSEDVTERERFRKERDLVTAELNHRVRNTLAVVQAIADHTGLVSDDIESFLESFNGRLAAMGRNFTALTDAHWSGLDFEDILRTELEPHVGPILDRVVFEGEAVKFSVRASKSTSMLVHELVTNACKYGFLTKETGALHVRWWIEQDRFHAEWRESGLENVRAPTKLGFGFQLFDTMPNIQVDPTFAPDGLKLKFSVPVSFSLATGEVSFD